MIKLGFGPVPLGDAPPRGKLRAFADYELIEQIGRGGMGVVYKARQVALNRLVALKMILAGELASAASVERFHIEAEAAANLHHPNIVPIYEIGERDGHHYFSMKLVEGQSLDKLMSEFALPKPAAAPLPKTMLRHAHSQIAQLLATVARAVHYAHQRGILHRDLKPSNILIDEDGTPYLADFGLARIASRGDSVTESGSIVGSVSYMAPEQAKGQNVSAAADIYSLGAILYELLTGKPPFRAETPMETLRQVSEQEPEKPTALNASVDPDLATICLKCLEKDPQRRYASAAGLADDLARWERFEPIRARPTTLPIRLQRWVRRNRTGTAFIATLFIGLAVATWFWWLALAEQHRKRDAVRSLLSELTGKLDALWGPPQPYVEIGSEALAVISGKEPQLARGVYPTRVTVGVFINGSPLNTAIEYAPLLAYLEREIQERTGTNVTLTLRIYNEQLAAAQDLSGGKLELLRMNAYLYVRAKEMNAALEPLVATRGPARGAVIFTRHDTGITNLAGLKGRTLAFGEQTSTITFWAKALLTEAGVTATNLASFKYAHEIDRSSYGNRPADIELMPAGYNSRESTVVRAVIRMQSFDAGIAVTNYQSRFNQEFLVLARFADSPMSWVGNTNLSSGLSAAFVQAMIDLRNPAVLSRLPGATEGYQRIQDGDFDRLRQAIKFAVAFDQSADDKPRPSPQSLKTHENEIP